MTRNRDLNQRILHHLSELVDERPYENFAGILDLAGVPNQEWAKIDMDETSEELAERMGLINTWFIADLHLGHKNALKYCNRPFANVELQEKAIIDNWNASVKDGDHIYILGDVSFTKLDKTCEVLEQLKGNKILIAGNHDAYLRRKPRFRDCFESVHDMLEIAIEDMSVPGGKQHIVLCHYPMASWNRARYGAWMLHGHVHGRFDQQNLGTRRYDCGVDSNHFSPVSFSQLKEHFQNVAPDDRDGHSTP